MKKISGWLLILPAMFVFSGCLAQNKPVEPYQDKPSQPSQSEMMYSASPKTLPAVEKNPQQMGYESNRGTDEAVTHPEMLLSSLTLVDDRIIAYETKNRQWQEFSQEAGTINLEEEQLQKIAGCQNQIQSILTAYNEMHEILLDASSGRTDVSSTEKLVAVEREDMAFLDGECQQIIKQNQDSGNWLTGTKNRLLEGKESEIAEAMRQKEYGKVVELYEQISPEDTPELSTETIYQYGRALLYTGNAQQAVQVLQNLLARIQRDSELQREFNIMKLVADLSFGLEDYNRAFEKYVDIINRYAGLGDNVEWARMQQTLIASRGEKGTEVKSFSELLLAYLSYNPELDGYRLALLARNFSENYPESPMYPTAARIYLEAKDKADAWFATVLDQINRLQTEKKFEEGLSYIEKIPRINLLPEKQEQLRALADQMITAQFEVAEKMKKAQEKELEEMWESGLTHLRAKEYDDAIEVFSSMLETSYGERAKMQIEEASQLAVQENRRQAAELFVRANRTTDLNTKIELLLASRELLQNILAKYPQSYLLDKVKRNMSRIEEEITAINPDLLNSTASGNDIDKNESSTDDLPAESPAPEVDTLQDNSYR